MQTKLKCLSFFSGCLGLDLGLKKEGIEHLLFCENDKFCKDTISKNELGIPLIDDLLLYSSEEIRKLSRLRKNQRPDLIVGGPPCQAFSTAGKRRSFKDPRGNVFLYFVKIIGELKPTYFVIENVRGLLSAPMKHRPHSQRGEGFPQLSEEESPGGALKHILRVLSKAGYEISFNLYNSANYGVPQKRERIIIIGNLNGSRVPYLKPTHDEEGLFDLPRWISFKEATKGLKEKEMNHIEFPEKRLQFYKQLKAGQNWRNLPENQQKEALGKSFYAGGGKTGFFRRLAWNKPSPSLVTHPAMPATDLCHPIKNRPLSVEEYKRIQQIPDSFKLSGSLIQQYKQIGNAVPVGLGRAVGRTLVDHANGSNWHEDEIKGFKFSRYKKTSEKDWSKERLSNQMSIPLEF